MAFASVLLAGALSLFVAFSCAVAISARRVGPREWTDSTRTGHLSAQALSRAVVSAGVCRGYVEDCEDIEA